MSMVKNYFHFNQIATIHRVVKISKSMKGTDLLELEECTLESANFSVEKLPLIIFGSHIFMNDMIYMYIVAIINA